MKKRWIIIGVAAALVVLLLILFLKMVMNPSSLARDEVDRIELRTYSHSYAPGKKQVELNEDEVDKILRLYNRAGYDSEIQGEPCCYTYWLEIYLKDGSVIRVAEGSSAYMIVTPTVGERYCLCDENLVNYIKELIATYELVRD